MAEPIVTPKFRVSFPQVFEPKAYQGQDPKYSLTMLFGEDADLGKLKAAAKAAVVEKYGDKVPKNFKTPFRKGEEKDHLDGYEEGITFVRATSTVEPEVVDRGKEPLTSQRDFYAGCYARAIVVPFCYDTAGNKGVSFGLRSVQKIADGAPFGAGGSLVDEFDELPDEDDGSAAAPEAAAGDGFLD